MAGELLEGGHRPVVLERLAEVERPAGVLAGGGRVLAVREELAEGPPLVSGLLRYTLDLPFLSI